MPVTFKTFSSNFNKGIRARTGRGIIYSFRVTKDTIIGIIFTSATFSGTVLTDRIDTVIKVMLRTRTIWRRRSNILTSFTMVSGYATG